MHFGISFFQKIGKSIKLIPINAFLIDLRNRRQRDGAGDVRFHVGQPSFLLGERFAVIFVFTKACAQYHHREQDDQCAAQHTQNDIKSHNDLRRIYIPIIIHAHAREVNIALAICLKGGAQIRLQMRAFA